MLNPADVLKVKCNFAQKVLAYLTKRKYVVDVCPCVLYPYYSEYGQVSIIEPDCLEFEQECAINNNKYAEITDCNATTIACDTQLPVSLNLTGSSCTLTASIDNQSNNSAYPVMSVGANSQLITGTAYLKVVQSGNCGSNTTYTELNSGNTSSGSGDEYEATFSFGFNSLNTFTGGDESFIKTLRVYKTDVFGTLINTPIDLDLDPSTSVYYSDNVDCPSCTALLGSDLYIGNPNFEDSFSTLMANVSLALTGASDNISITASSNGSNYIVRCKAWNQPISYLVGINSSDPYIVVSDPNGSGSNFIQTKINSYYGTSSRFYYAETYEASDPLYDCAILPTVTVGDQWTLPNVNASATSFNVITLSSIYGTKALSITSSPKTVTCGIDVLHATYDNTDVDNVYWTGPSLSTISYNDYAVADDDGTYTFYVQLNSGCIISESIRYP